MTLKRIGTLPSNTGTHLSRKEGSSLRGQPRPGVDRRTEALTSVPGRGRLLSPFTRRFRLGFALLRGGSRIDKYHHRAGVLSLDGSTEHFVLTPLTGLGASEHSRDSPFSLLHLLGPPATPTRCLSSYLVPSGNPLGPPSSPTGMDCVLMMRDSKVSQRFRGSWGSWGGVFRVGRSLRKLFDWAFLQW